MNICQISIRILEYTYLCTIYNNYLNQLKLRKHLIDIACDRVPYRTLLQCHAPGQGNWVERPLATFGWYDNIE